MNGMTDCRRVVGFPGYFVTDAGQVISCRRRTPLLLTANKSGTYPTVSLCRQGEIITRSVHSLVAEAFIGPRPARNVCRHLDGDPFNPSLSNLAYGTFAENEADKERHGRRLKGSEVHGSRLKASDVIEMRRLYAAGEQYVDLLNRWPVNESSLHRAIHGFTWKHIPVPDYSSRKTVYEDGHFNQGQRHPNAKLTEATARRAIDMLARGMRTDSIGAALGVSRQNVAHIAAGRTWVHLSRPWAAKAAA